MPDAQSLRIFDDGHRLEPVIVSALRSAGLTVHDVDPATGKQFHFEALGGHVAANLDGIIVRSSGSLCGLEVKSMNAKMFAAFVKKGVAVSHPEYLDQVTLGMGLSDIGEFLLVARCKDNAKYEAEFIEFDKSRFDALMSKAKAAMFSAAAERHDTWDCTRCHKRTACKVGATPPIGEGRHCRHCRYAVPDVLVPGKRWNCGLHSAVSVSIPCADFAPYRPSAPAPAVVTVHKPAKKRKTK